MNMEEKKLQTKQKSNTRKIQLQVNLCQSHSFLNPKVAYLTTLTYLANLLTGLSSPGVPDFGRSINPFSTKGDRLCPPNNTGTPRPSEGPDQGCKF